MECGICLQTIINSCVSSCIHHFCYECMIKWCKHSNHCPKCRSFIYELHFDPEFDVINGALDIEIENININHKKIYLKLPENTLAGITLKNNRGPGVIISKLSLNGQAKLIGLKVGDIILFMNGVPCRNHEQSINIINEATKSGHDVVCILL